MKIQLFQLKGLLLWDTFCSAAGRKGWHVSNL